MRSDFSMNQLTVIHGPLFHAFKGHYYVITGVWKTDMGGGGGSSVILPTILKRFLRGHPTSSVRCNVHLRKVRNECTVSPASLLSTFSGVFRRFSDRYVLLSR